MKVNDRFKRIFLNLLIISLSLGAILGMITVLAGDQIIPFQVEIIMTSILLGGMSCLGFCSSVHVGKPKLAWLTMVSFILYVITFLYGLVMIWIDAPLLSFTYERWYLLLVILSIHAAQIALLLLVPAGHKIVRAVRSLTFTAIGLVSAYAAVTILQDTFVMTDTLAKILGILIIIDGFGTILTPILGKKYGGLDTGTVIEKKIHPKYFEAVKDGSKTFELRLADWKCVPGDILLLREWNPEIKEYTGRELRKRVTYVLQTKGIDLWPQRDIDEFGYQIISFR